MLTREQILDLGDYLMDQLGNRRCDHTLTLTERWLVQQRVPDIDAVLTDLAANSAYCDCEVIFNVVLDELDGELVG